MGYDSITFKEAIQHRRTIDQLNKKAPITNKRIEQIIKTTIHNMPSSFNAQSTRLVVLLQDEHDKFWDIVRDILEPIVPADSWSQNEHRIDILRNAYGTILFYEDPEPIKVLQSKFTLYADKFPQWSEHTSAMHQYVLWCALEAEGFGCNLQHYNPLPDQKVSDVWNVPAEWSLKAQVVFGGEAEGARDQLSRDQQPLEKRLFIYGA